MKPFSVIKYCSTLGGVLLLTGCSDLDDRPFVMACMAENVYENQDRHWDELKKDTDSFDFTAGGITLPSPEEMDRRAREIFDGKIYTNAAEPSYHVGYFGQGILSDTQGELPEGNTTVAPFSEKSPLLASYGKSDQIVQYSGRRDGDAAYLIDRTGNAEIEHFYIDGDGELQPISFQMAALNVGRVSTNARPLTATHRQLHFGSMIPSDAKYVVYKATWQIDNFHNHDPGNTFTGFWAQALTDDERYQPGDYGTAEDSQWGFGSYVSWMNVSNGRKHGNQPTEGGGAKLAPDVTSNGGVKGSSVPCYGLAGQPVPSSEFFRLKNSYKEKNAIFPYSIKSPGGFVGTKEEDLSNLPSNPSAWDDEKDQYRNQRIEL